MSQQTTDADLIEIAAKIVWETGKGRISQVPYESPIVQGNAFRGEMAKDTAKAVIAAVTPLIQRQYLCDLLDEATHESDNVTRFLDRHFATFDAGAIGDQYLVTVTLPRRVWEWWAESFPGSVPEEIRRMAIEVAEDDGRATRSDHESMR